MANEAGQELREPLIDVKDQDPADEPQQLEEPVAKRTSLYGEILSIALPMLAALAADPIASLMDTMFVGHIGRAHLAGVGTAVSIFNSTTKLFNVPLLAVTTSLVASAGGRVFDSKDAVSAAASSSILIALAIGLLEAVVLALAAGPIASLWGASEGSDLQQPTVEFLQLRALGAPATVLLLVLQGVFRGLQDTRTPFFATVVASTINIALDPLLIFTAGLGVRGAALATIIAQVIPCVWLVVALARRYPLKLRGSETLWHLWALLPPTGYLIARTCAVTLTYALATSVADRAGSASAATHQICFQIWMSCSLLADALAVASQSIIAKSIGSADFAYARRCVDATLRLGFCLGVLLTVMLGLLRGWLPTLFTGDEKVLGMLPSLMPFVVLTQPLNALAFVWDGVLFGAGGFKYAALSMPLNAAPAVAMMLVAQALVDDPTSLLYCVWAALSVVMAMRALTSWLPFQLRVYPYTPLFAEKVPLLADEPV